MKTILSVFSLPVLLATLFANPAVAADFPAEKIYKAYGPSVVLIWASSSDQKGSVGAGSVISQDGLVVTNAHVITMGEAGLYPEIAVCLKPDRLTGDPKRDLTNCFKAAVLGVSADIDIAVLRADGLPKLKNLICLADPEDVGIGQEVVAIGHPEQGGFWSLTYGRISAEFADFEGVTGKNMYQTDTSMNRGNSGGPLLDARGCMVGVNTSIARRSSADNLAITGVNFALQSQVVRDWLNSRGAKVAYAAKQPVAAEATPTVSETKQPVAETKPPVTDTKPPVEEKRAEKRYETPKRPYNYDELTKVEKELGDMMEEMRGKTRR
ncbi:MAG: trypsin-like peptidase domain-containing protein [Nitrospirae bacterium]|nr:trypsin-like peptidase domain-containing protein [Nitrospirota bacterium]